MCDITDEASPYYDDYTEFDYWCYANALSSEDMEDESLWLEGPEEGHDWVYALVDDNGYMVPQLAAQQAQIDSYLGDAEQVEDSCDKGFTAYGVLPTELAEQYYGAQAWAYAPYTEQIPKWLAESPPAAALVLPEGDVCVMGELGEGEGKFMMDWGTFDNLPTWHHYSAEGEKLASAEPGDEWSALFMDNYAELKARSDEQDNVELMAYGEYIVLYTYTDDWSTTETEIYDYHGNKLEISEDEMWMSMGNLDPIPGGMLKYIYEAQN